MIVSIDRPEPLAAPLRGDRLGRGGRIPPVCKTDRFTPR